VVPNGFDEERTTEARLMGYHSLCMSILNRMNHRIPKLPIPVVKMARETHRGGSGCDDFGSRLVTTTAHLPAYP
jgi:hypothetical protein